MRTLVLLVLLAASTLGAQSKKVVVMGQPESLVAELRSVKPSNVNIVHITDPDSDADVVAIVADSPEDMARQKALLKEVADADAIIGAPSPEVVNAAKKLKWLQITSAGVEPYLIPEIVNSDIVMTNAKTLSAPAIADHGFGMLLALTRKLNHFIAVRPKEEWERKNFELQELEGKTAVVIGTGGMGRM